MKVKLDPGAKLPTRAHPTDAGLDLYSAYEVDVPPHQFTVIPTGVHVELPHGTAGLLVSKSGLNCKYGITTTGLIDEGYSGEIKVSMINNSDQPYHVRYGDKITQLVIIPVLYEDVQLTDLIVGGDRQSNGFGSSGR